MKKLIFLLPIFLFADIKKIEYKGLIHISPVTANTIIKIKPGDSFNIKKIDESILQLYNTGYFQTIKAEENNNTLIFNCLEKPILYSVSLSNFSEDLKKILKEKNLIPKKGEIFSNKKINNLKQFIKSYYLAQGYFNSSVIVKKQFLKPTLLKLTLSVKKGEYITIKKVNFFGARKLSKSTLLDEVENRPRTFWSEIPFTNSGKLNIYKLIADMQSLQNYYFNLGFMDAKVSSPLSKINFDNYTTVIDWHIHEGKRYIINNVSIDYPKDIKVSLPKISLKKGYYFNVSALRQDLKNIQHAFANEGYAYAKVFPKIIKKGTKANITYEVIPGNIVYIKNVIIKGDTKTLDRVVRRTIYLAPGDKYSYQNIIDSKNALQRSGYLENVKIKEKKVSDNQIDLIVNVTEGLSGSLRAGISYGNNGFGVMFSVSERNLFGSGQSISASANLSQTTSTYKFSLFNPMVFDSKYSFNTSIFDTRNEAISYTSKQKGMNIGIGKKLSKFVRANVTYGYAKTKLSDYNITEYIMPESTKSYIISSISFDNTNNYLFPTQGQKAALSVEFAGIGGDEKYIKSIASYKYFYPLMNKSYQTYAVLKYRVILGVIKSNGYLPIDEKFYLGGDGSVRGFESYSISPKDSEGNLIGGKYEFITGPEISTHLSKKNKLWLNSFIDYGAIGDNSLDITRMSWGFSFNWITPMGPLTFTWAWPIKKAADDKLQTFTFSFGKKF